MLRSLSQVAAITWMNLQTLPQRLSSSAVSVIGIAGVVAVLVAVLSISEGFRATLGLAGAEDVAIAQALRLL